jgi:hypothetical protein
VALGAEDRTAAEKVNAAFADAAAAVKDTVGHALEFLRHPLGGAAAPTPEPGVLARTRETWDAASARTLSSLFRARDTAAEYTDAALARVGLKEPEAVGVLGRARRNLDGATHRLLTALGYGQPSTWDRLKGYAASTGSKLGGIGGAPSGIGGGIGGGMAPPGGMVDAALKRVGLREASLLDRAAGNYYGALHRFRAAVGAESPSAGERMGMLIEEQRNRVNEILQAALEERPASPTLASAGRLPEAARARANALLEAARADADAVLKSLHLRDKSTGEALRENITSAWHDFKVIAGAEQPGVLEAASYALGTKGGLAGAWDRALKRAGLRPKSGVETAVEAYNAAAHRFQMALGREDPTLTERFGAALADARDKLGDVAEHAGASIPFGGTITHLPAAARGRFEALSAPAIAALLRTREGMDAALKSAGVVERGPLEHARAAVDESLKALWVALGWSDPSLLARVESAWHRAKLRAGMEEPTVLEKVAMRLDAAGSQFALAEEEAGQAGKSGFARAKRALGFRG